MESTGKPIATASGSESDDILAVELEGLSTLLDLVGDEVEATLNRLILVKSLVQKSEDVVRLASDRAPIRSELTKMRLFGTIRDRGRNGGGETRQQAQPARIREAQAKAA